MVLTSLIDQARTTTFKWWKWILVALIAALAAFLAWRLRKRARELLALRTEYVILCDCLEDLKVRAAATHDINEANELSKQVATLTAQQAQREQIFKARQQEYVTAKIAVDQAQTWEQLERRARKRPPP